MLHYLLLHLFVLPMISLHLNSTGITAGKLRVKNNRFHATIVIIRHRICLYFTNKMAIGFYNKVFHVLCFILFNIKYAIHNFIINT